MDRTTVIKMQKSNVAANKARMVEITAETSILVFAEQYLHGGEIKDIVNKAIQKALKGERDG